MWAPKYQRGRVKLDKLGAQMAPGILKLFATLPHHMNLFRKYHAFTNKIFQVGYMQYAFIKYSLVLVIYAFFIKCLCIFNTYSIQANFPHKSHHYKYSGPPTSLMTKLHVHASTQTCLSTQTLR